MELCRQKPDGGEGRVEQGKETDTKSSNSVHRFEPKGGCERGKANGK